MQESRFEHDFEVVKVVGKGSFGTVHKVKSRVDGVHYAVKSARARFKGKSHREHTMKEVYALAALSAESDHEGARHVVRYYHAWIEDERLYIQTELCDASLEKRLSKGPLLSRDVWNFLRQLLLALDFLHSKQIVHLDIKPDNIFVNLRDTDVYKLGDFGLVARSNDGDVVEGDSRYMSKELLEDDDLIFAARAEGRGPAKKDLTKCDIFSLGATTYEICRGEGKPLPPNGPEWHALRNEQLVFAPSQQRETPLDLQRCIATMMLSDPSLRPTASALLSDHPALQSKVQQLTHQLERERHHVAQFRNQLISLSQPHRLSRSNTWA